MAHYAVGDIQGCYRELMELLDRVGFSYREDKLWVVGDMVSRGPDSDEVLRFLFKQRDSVHAVLGNHDLHLIAICHGVKKPKPSDLLAKTLKANARHDWIDWLRTLPLCFHDDRLAVTMVHAGLAPQWSVNKALGYSAEVEAVLQSDAVADFVGGMYGNTPAGWNADLQGIERLRCITNFFTRMRVLDSHGAMDFAYKGDLSGIEKGYYPWFKHPERKSKKDKIVFGHWAALGGYVDDKLLFGLDTGCVWGRHMTLLNLETQDLTIAQSQA